MCESQDTLLCGAGFVVQGTEDDIWIMELKNTGSGERSNRLQVMDNWWALKKGRIGGK
jgi:hypothetical protein